MSELYYGEYLAIDSLLNLQKPESLKNNSHSKAHDEMLFIITHQAFELWFKQIIFELDLIIKTFQQKQIKDTELGSILIRCERILEILNVLKAQIRVIETMTPLDFLDFRDQLGAASGLQSVQFRILELKLGLMSQKGGAAFINKLLPNYARNDKIKLQKIQKEENLFLLVEKWLERLPFLNYQNFDFWQHYSNAVQKMLINERLKMKNHPYLSEHEKEQRLKEIQNSENEFSYLLNEDKYQDLINQGKRTLSHKATLAALFIELYRDAPLFHLPFKILQSLINIDENLTSWRYNHAMLAHRMLGTKIGTGGTAGRQYLINAAEKNRFFTDFFNLSTFLIPRSEIPELPKILNQPLRIGP